MSVLKRKGAKKLTQLSPDGTGAFKIQRDIAGRKRQRCTKKSIVCSGGRILRYPLGPRC